MLRKHSENGKLEIEECKFNNSACEAKIFKEIKPITVTELEVGPTNFEMTKVDEIK